MTKRVGAYGENKSIEAREERPGRSPPWSNCITQNTHQATPKSPTIAPRILTIIGFSLRATQNAKHSTRVSLCIIPKHKLKQNNNHHNQRRHSLRPHLTPRSFDGWIETIGCYKTKQIANGIETQTPDLCNWSPRVNRTETIPFVKQRTTFGFNKNTHSILTNANINARRT